MKRVCIFAMAIALLLMGSAGILAEGAFEESFTEASFGTEILGDESFFAEEAFSAEEAFLADAFVLPEEAVEAEAMEERSVVTLLPEYEADPDEELTDDNWWKMAPVLNLEPGKKSGKIILTWTQAHELPNETKREWTAQTKNVFYIVYRQDPSTAAWIQVTKAKMKQVWDGDLQVAGGKVKLSAQPAGAKYFLRAEKIVSKTEVYGLPSNSVEGPVYDDSKTLKHKAKILSLDLVDRNRARLIWESPTAVYTKGEEKSGFKVERTVKCGRSKTSNTYWIYSEEDLLDEGIEFFADRYMGMGTYELFDTLPEGATGVTYTVQPVKNGEDLNEKKAKKALVLKPDAWKNVYPDLEMPLARLYTVGSENRIEFYWRVSAGVADDFQLTGAQETIDILYDGEKGAFVPLVKDNKFTPDLTYGLFWSITGDEGKTEVEFWCDNPETGAVLYVNSVEIKDAEEKGQILGTLFSATDVEGWFHVHAPSKTPTSKKIVKASIKPKLQQKAGKTFKYKAAFEDWRTAPVLSDLIQIGDGRVRFCLDMKEWEKDVEYTVTGQKETVTIGFKYEEDDVLTPTVTGDAVVEDVLAEERWIYNPETDEDGWKMVPYRIVLNCGSAVSGSVKVQVTPQKGNERGLASNKLSIEMVPRKSSAGAVGMRSQIVEDEETGASSRMIRFGNANTSAVRFTVSVRRSYLDEAENIAEPDADGYYMCFTAADAQAEGGYTDDGGNTVTYDPQTDTYSIEFSGLEDGAYTILVETFDSEDKRYLVKKAEYRFEKNDYVGMEIIDY